MLAVVSAVPAGAVAGSGDLTVEFTGGGFGHAVGLPQYGALGYALEHPAASGEDIVEHFYKGTLVDDLAAVVPASNFLRDVDDSLWVGLEQDVTSFAFVVHGPGVSICHRSECPMSPAPADGETWTVRRQGGQCTFERDDGFTAPSADCWAGVSMDEGSWIEVPQLGRSYDTGTLRIRPNRQDPAQRTGFHVSLSIDLEAYVAGIAEVPDAWDAAALEAQAIAARTYGANRAMARETGTRSGSGLEPALSLTWRDNCYCHVRSDTRDQVYAGRSQSSLANWSAATTATAGRVVTDPDAPGWMTEHDVIEAYYSSSSGGTTESNTTGFGSSSQYPYLVPVDDPYSVTPAAGNPYATWTMTKTEDELLAGLAPGSGVSPSCQVDLDDLLDVRLLNPPPGALVRFVGVAGGQQASFDVPGRCFRSLGFRSGQIFSIDVEGASGVKQTWHQDVGTVQSPVEAGDRFGSVFATGDFDGDGFDDLAVAGADDGVGSVPTAGVVNILFGTATGLDDAGNQMLHQDLDGNGDPAEASDRFGAAMVAADFDGDGFDDLAVGAPGEGVAGRSNAGAVQVYFGSPSGLSFAPPVLSQSTAGIGGASEDNDQFGAELAAGDVNGDGFGDLVVGVPGEDLNGRGDAGRIVVIPGGSAGLDASRSIGVHQGSPGVPGAVESGDRFGAALAAGDFDGDGLDDLAVGAPGEAIGLLAGAGSVTLVEGSTGVLDLSSARTLHQATPGIPGAPEGGDAFGAALAAGDMNSDGRADLAIGVPGESIGSRAGAGFVVTIVGSASGLAAGGATGWHQNTAGVAGASEAGDGFGGAIAVGDLDGDGRADLVVGVPGESIGAVANAGLVVALPGTGAGVTAAGSWIAAQGSTRFSGSPHSGDDLGAALAVGAFDGLERVMLVAGAPGEDLGVGDGGVAHVWATN